ncbi:putative zinc finger protein CONSTANS-LIKE 11 [Acorus calamus]|uniref:Zinc finger protein CONSTANS-LIKE 11 n=1 Tax=Acorus calamus TaxID=4465 RepID=A0AAV9E7D2_ACOCL|nr:putative zinc finger protein CONSTANS-LIKE 11 [Acorus calamus]
MKECELCKGTARIYCESDSASLCWDCDARVHGANFLVERHCRRLLCQACQEPTPWTAAGARLGPTVSVCVRCFGRCSSTGTGGDRKSEIAGNEDGDVISDSEGEEEEAEEEEGENQVVPWTDSSAAGTPPPPGASSSSSGETMSPIGYSLKRMRDDDAVLDFQDDLGRTNPRRNSTEDEATSPSWDFRASKRGAKAGSSSMVATTVPIGSLNRSQREASPLSLI